MGFSGYVELGDDGQWVGEGECGVKEEVRDGRGGEGERGMESDLMRSGHQLGTSWCTPAGTQYTPAALWVRSTMQLTCNCDQRHIQYG